MTSPVFDRRRSERFAELVSEAQGQRRHHRRTDLDGDLAGLVGIARRVDTLRTGTGPDPDFRIGLRAMLLAKIERDGIGVTADEKAAQAAARAALADTTQVIRRIQAGGPGRTRAAVLIGVAAGALALSGVSAASTDALPGDPLYQIKRSSERAQLALAGSDVSRGQLYLEFARGRYEEARRVDAAGFASALAEMNAETRRGVRELTTAGVHRGEAGALDAVLRFINDQRSRLEGVLGLPGGARSAELVRQSVALLDAIEARVLALKAALAQGCTTDAVDELGPMPGSC